ncbi:uncharacterized protein LOC8081647 isoform X2 [Sorghum bicolor]|uniref:uncharacterized protein LOC8081647 isoform X2 n=1 Tax=Sorghum bicolor TaxID=4558 RepID=UPI0007F2BF5F|nr:uncharacterized protein LOC8081647 isoform X2 [Sorghum bicolor]|eukprot:XP_021315431.1 uncharacterized protein LOC8081647 isoform X2 [Sorghum bicolor]
MANASNVYRFQVLLPSGLSSMLTFHNPGYEISVSDLLLKVKGELGNTQWDVNGKVYLTDLLDRIITDKIKLSNFDTKSVNILKLHDGKGGSASIYENMWDLTPQTDLLEELPAEYSTESALADLTDNALQALWSNGHGERKLIKITLDKEKIVIFDTGRGMDGSDGNSISKWGTMGSSNHRVFRRKGIGQKAPYLVPFFGMFGYGGTIASMHLGRIAIVSSKTKESKKVFTLHLSKEALLKNPSSKNSEHTWKTAGGLRDPSKEEILLSPHQSFTQVEICGLKAHLEEARLRGFLKDIYFPYIQYDEDSEWRNTRNPVEFEVNGVNLSEVPEGEVTVTNMHSSNGPDFIVHMKFTQKATASCIAHARLRCVYFPIIQGKESIDSILEKLRFEGCEIKENFDNFSRVSIRRLGRLLPDARWGSLPFMVPKQKKGQKAEFFRRCCKRVKCFVETDAGLYPTRSKTDLAQHDPFTKALRNWGSNYLNSSSAEEVDIEAHGKDGKLLSHKQFEKQYYDWITEMHEKYDAEMDGGDDEPTLIINPSCKERLGISIDVEVVRVHTSISRRGQTWRRGDHLKILKGAIGQVKTSFYTLKNSLCTTLEYIVVEGLQGDICGEARLICRPIEYPDGQGCYISKAEDTSPDIYIQESVSFPVSIIDDGKCKIMDDGSWNQMLKKRKEKAPASIEVIRNIHGLGGDLPYEDVMAGYQQPHEIIAVLRPGNYKPSSTNLPDQKNIVKDDDLEMVMEVRYLMSKDGPAKLIHKRVKPSSHNDIDGLYVFPLRGDSLIFSKSGVYQFIFSVDCRDSSVIHHKSTLTVCPDTNSRQFIFSVADFSTDKTFVDIRVGCPIRCLAVRSHDKYGNRIPFLDTSSVIATILYGDDVLAQVDNIEVELSSDSLTLNIMDFRFKTSNLDLLRPKYEAKLKISSSADEFSGICRCEVKPGHPSTINIDMSLFPEKNLTPGRLIDNFFLEVFDQFSNHVEEETKLNVHVDGMCFLDKQFSVQKVNSTGFIDLCGKLRVVWGFGSEACITIFHNDKEIFTKIFQIATRELKAVNVPESCRAGSFLENITFEVYDSDGLIDESIDGPLHTLNITSNELALVEGAQYAIKHGRCVLSRVQLPHEQGTVTIMAYHTYYPDDLHIEIQLQVQSFDLALTTLEDGSEPILSCPISFIECSNLSLPSQLAPGQPSHLITYVKDVVKKTKNKVGDTLSKIKSTEETLKSLCSRKGSLEKQIDTIKDEIRFMVGSFIDAKELVRDKIRENIGTAACVVCSSGDFFVDDVVGIVALLGTVPDGKISRMLAVYLGKDDMLSVVCKTQEAANYIEKYNTDGGVDVDFGIHREASALGVPIKRRFAIICLEDIEPYKGGVLLNSPQKELNLAWPSPHASKPKGFRGFAVNMINLSDDNLNITTSRGHGLRETLFYSLFGELQVYETRNDMLQAMPYLNGGAISLDGGVMKGKGKLLLGYSDPKITFPVVSGLPNTITSESNDHLDVVTRTRNLDSKMKLLEVIETKISEQKRLHEELVKEFNKRKRKFEEIEERITQPCGNELVLRDLQQVKVEEPDP